MRKVNWSDRELVKKAVDSSKNISDALRYLGLVVTGGNNNTLKSYIIKYEIDTSHFETASERQKKQLDKIRRKKSLSEVLVNDGKRLQSGHKKRLFKEGVLEERCSVCGIGAVWNHQRLVLQIDHINGDSGDNRVKNLRPICPNCHSQTNTYAGRNNSKSKGKLGGTVDNRGKHPKNKGPKPERRKVKNRPAKSILRKEVKELGYCAVGRKYGVSDNAIRKWINSKY